MQPCVPAFSQFSRRSLIFQASAAQCHMSYLFLVSRLKSEQTVQVSSQRASTAARFARHEEVSGISWRVVASIPRGGLSITQSPNKAPEPTA